MIAFCEVCGDSLDDHPDSFPCPTPKVTDFREAAAPPLLRWASTYIEPGVPEPLAEEADVYVDEDGEIYHPQHVRRCTDGLRPAVIADPVDLAAQAKACWRACGKIDTDNASDNDFVEAILAVLEAKSWTK